MFAVEGVYFDGITSVPNTVEVTVDFRQGYLSFLLSEKGEIRCNLSETRVEYMGSVTSIYFTGSELGFLKIENREFTSHFKKEYAKTGNPGIYQKLINLGFGVHVTIAFFIMVLIVMVYYYVIPWIGENAAGLIHEDYDLKLGNTFYDEYIKHEDVDSVKTAFLEQFASHIDFNNTKQLKFTVVESDEVNAFALPNGRIVVFSGILKDIKSYEELAGLLSHEAIHVNNRHSMKMLCRNLAGYIFISIIFTDVNGIMAVIGENANNLQSLTFSRKFEREADTEGLRLLIKNQIDPEGMVRLFERLQRNTEKLIPEFAKSHPLTQNRLKYIGEMVKTDTAKYGRNAVLDDIFGKMVERKDSLQH